MTASLAVPDLASLEAVAERLATMLPKRAVIYLQGPLGAGKTAFVRALLKSLRWEGPVPSPTYTLLESYEVGERLVLHWDLYRLADPEELEFLAVRDLHQAPAVWLVEWPERGAGHLPPCDLRIGLQYSEPGRQLQTDPRSDVGRALARAMIPEGASGG